MSVGTYRRRVVGERLQVSHVGVNEPPSAFDLGADVVIRSKSNESSQTETHTQGQTGEEGCSDCTLTAESSTATYRSRDS